MKCKYRRYCGGVSDCEIKRILWSAYETVFKSQLNFGLEFFFAEEPRPFRKPKLTLCLASNYPGIVIGPAGSTVTKVTNDIQSKYPQIEGIQVIESAVVDKNPLA